MAESLPELIARRMGEQGITSLLALHKRLPEGGDSITYETVRNLANGKQRGTRDERVIRDLATILAVNENEVRDAMGVERTYGPWEMPARAQGLDPTEREVVIGMVDALLRAKRGGSNEGRQPKAEKSPDPASDGASNVTTLTPKHQRMIDEAQMEDQAAYDGGEPEGEQ